MAVDQNWMLDEVTVVRGVRHAVVLSADGLVRTYSAQTSRDDAERLAAACAGLKSIGRSLAREFGTSVGNARQVMVEFDGYGGYLFVRGAGDGSHLAVITEQSVDPALKIGESNFRTPRRED